MSVQFGNRLRQERLRRHLSQEALAEALAFSARSIRRWEQGQALPQASVRLQLCRFFGLSPEALFENEKTQAPKMPLMNVLYPRNPFFTGREEILTMLHASLSPDDSVAFAQVYALQGLGGVGKTQIALEYVYRYAQEYQAVFWIGAETSESIIFSLLRLAESIEIPKRDEKDQQQVIAAVLHWFTTHDRWLLICDNVEDLSILTSFIPPVRLGAILLTTRLRTLGTYAKGIHLLPMQEEESLLLLMRRAKIFSAEATREQVHQFSTQAAFEYAAGVELVKATGGLPLALDQAGAYLEATQCGLPAYLDLFCTRRAALLQQRGEGVLDHPLPVSTTFELAITATAQRHPAVWDLLRVCALLQPDAIPEELFHQGAKQLGAPLGDACGDALEWNQVVAVAYSYSLLSRQPEAQALSIHRLVQAVLLDIMSEAERKKWVWRVVEALDAVFPEVQPTTEFASWRKQCDRLVPHVLLCLHRTEEAEDSLALASLAFKVGQYLRERGQYGEAKLYCRRALHIREQILGPDHHETAHALNNLAVIYWKMGAYAEAEPLLQRVLLIRREILGNEHSDVATTLNYLALLYWKIGKYAEAEPLFQRALHIWEQTLSSHHPYIAHPLNNLAILYAEQGKYVEAEAFFRRALYIWEQTLPHDHPDVAQGLHNLAELSQDQGKYEEAESLYQRVLGVRVQALGSDHPDVAETLHSLATLYRDQGKYAEAEPLFQRVLHIWGQSQGGDHPNVALVLNELANLSRDQGKYVEAEDHYQQALSIREQKLGPQHPETAQTLHDLALFSQKQGHLGKALSLAERALEIRSQSLGDDHPKTVATCELYTQLAQEQGRAEQDPPSSETGRMDA